MAWLQRDEKRRRRIDPGVAQAYFLIHPELPYAAGPARSCFAQAQALGEQAARKALPELRERLRCDGLLDRRQAKAAVP